jgi:hypothetical protein
MRRVAFFHGLESPPRSEKNDALERMFTHIYAPAMDYTDPKLFDTVLAEVKKQKVGLLIGSSMGGWFAYCISTLTGIPTLLFNPAVQGRSLDPKVKMGSSPANHTVVLGKKDAVIDPNKTIDWFTKNGVGTPHYNWEPIEHRIPIDVFMRWIKSPIPANRISESFQKFVNEEWSTDTPVGTDWSFLPEEVIQTLIPNFMTNTPAVGGRLTVENSKEIHECIRECESLQEDNTEFILQSAIEPCSVFSEFLSSKGKGNMKAECNEMWENKKLNEIIDIVKEEVKRSRPYWIDDRIKPMEGTEEFSYSFPSGHAAASRFIALYLSEKFPDLKSDLLKLSEQISRTRIQAGVHFPSDVNAGLALGECIYELNK